MEANQQYLLDKHRKTDNKIETLREYAEQNAVPIVDRLSLEMIKQLIRYIVQKHSRNWHCNRV